MLFLAEIKGLTLCEHGGGLALFSTIISHDMITWASLDTKVTSEVNKNSKKFAIFFSRIFEFADLLALGLTHVISNQCLKYAPQFLHKVQKYFFI
jgi:hypothetical protein